MQSADTSQNFFELFGIEPAFDIDRVQLQDRQRQLQSSFHPDRHVNAGEREKRVAIQMASWINQAHDVLKDPVKRARYLLELNGADIPDDSATTSDTAFLMEQIELREQVETCREREDGLEFSRSIESQLRHRADELAAAFVTAFDNAEFPTAVEAYRKMQFIQRIQHQLDELQFELEDF